MRDFITCHVLDTVKGLPATGIPCTLFERPADMDVPVSQGTTDKDGRISQWDVPVQSLLPGVYKIKFDTEKYLTKSTGGKAFFPFVEVVFTISDLPAEHYHIPLLLSNYSYSTYRGS